MRSLVVAAAAFAAACGGGDGDGRGRALSVTVTASGSQAAPLEAFAVMLRAEAAAGALVELVPVGTATRLELLEGPDGEYTLTSTGLPASYEVSLDGTRMFTLQAPAKPTVTATSTLGGTRLEVTFTGVNTARVCATQMGGVGECKSGASPMTFMVAVGGKPFVVDVLTVSGASGASEEVSGAVNLTTKLDVP